MAYPCKDEDFNLTLQESPGYFADVTAVSASAILVDLLGEQVNLAVAINTEKARSELIIAPVLMEIRRQCQSKISLFSGSGFTVDPTQGLTGICDFILSKNPE